MSDEMIGCGDNSCIFKQLRPGGVGTNGGCRCFTEFRNWDPLTNTWNDSEVRKVRQDTQRLASELRRARQQVAELEALCREAHEGWQAAEQALKKAASFS